MLSAIEKIYKTRYFWFYLAKSDIRFKYRRSKLGYLWAVIQPLGITVIMAIVFSIAFKQPLGDYAVYILSGLIGWNLLMASVVSGGQSLISAAQYIRQYNHPKIIYSLKTAIVYLYNFLMELIGLVIWIALTDAKNLVISALTFPVTIILLFAVVWELVTIVSYINAKYYDYPQLMTLVMQAVYYVSPVFFKEELFEANNLIYMIYQYNPVTQILNLIREPFLYGRIPDVFTYAYVIVMIIVLFGIAYFVNKKNSGTIIFYL